MIIAVYCQQLIQLAKRTCAYITACTIEQYLSLTFSSLEEKSGPTDQENPEIIKIRSLEPHPRLN